MQSNKINIVYEAQENSSKSSQNRPVSPHLSIYKPQMTSTLSIFHRISGALLGMAFIALIVVLKLYTYFGTNYSVYSIVTWLNESSNWLVATLFFMLLFSFYYHVCNGIRHLCWDFGYGFDLKKLYRSGYIVLISSFVLTVITWILPGIL